MNFTVTKNGEKRSYHGRHFTVTKNGEKRSCHGRHFTVTKNGEKRSCHGRHFTVTKNGEKRSCHGRHFTVTKNGEKRSCHGRHFTITKNGEKRSCHVPDTLRSDSTNQPTNQPTNQQPWRAGDTGIVPRPSRPGYASDLKTGTPVGYPWWAPGPAGSFPELVGPVSAYSGGLPMVGAWSCWVIPRTGGPGVSILQCLGRRLELLGRFQNWSARC